MFWKLIWEVRTLYCVVCIRVNKSPYSGVCSSGGLLHWSQSSSETSPSLEVEISSYVLLASLSASSRSTSDLGYASRIVRWLVRQQNAYGGFSSTQVYFLNTSGLKRCTSTNIDSYQTTGHVFSMSNLVRLTSTDRA